MGIAYFSHTISMRSEHATADSPLPDAEVLVQHQRALIGAAVKLSDSLPFQRIVG